ncbi:family 20 glycosylhydrolase [Georgenia sp. MJ206]|uniref:family 20 glycosylhydrolase n=1 Tax=Georgenia wangjunii TaxID=3117730 RepID=UPI002F261DDE
MPAPEPALIPAPDRLDLTAGAPFVLGGGTRVLVADEDDAAWAVGEHLAAGLAAAAVTPHVVTVDDGAPGAIVLALVAAPAGDDAGSAPVPAEAYSVTVDAERVRIEAADAVGLFRGVTTLLQLLDGSTLPAGRVVDAPRYAWRGLMVDVTRHWFGPEILREVVDLMAAYKLNVLHLHLTDDQGWRLEIASRPRLTEVSGRTQVGGEGGGFLTAQDYAELVAYAASRHVTVVPEIDTPGHTNAALHAYGELTPSGEPRDVYAGTDVGHSHISLTEPATRGFLEDVLGEVCTLTPGPYVHMGGDEVPTLSAEDYRAVVEATAGIIADGGKTPVVWQEAAVADLPAGALVQLWDPGMATAGVLAAAARGHDVILSPAKHVYLDLKYEPGFPLGLDWAGHVDVRESYAWDPATYLADLDPARVRGVEAALWTETVTTRDELLTMLLPRLAAVAEVAWSAQERRSFDSLRERVAAHGPRWAAAGLAYHPSSQVEWAD